MLDRAVRGAFLGVKTSFAQIKISRRRPPKRLRPKRKQTCANDYWRKQRMFANL